MKCILLLPLILISSLAFSAYPNGPLKMIVPFPAGGPTDVMARLVSNKLGDALGQPIYVENKAGAHGAIGMQTALAAPADGQTLVMVSIGTNGINPGLYKKLSYDVNKDFVPVSLLVTVPIVIVTRVDALWKFCAWLIACFPSKIIVILHYFYSRIRGLESRSFFDNRFLKPNG